VHAPERKRSWEVPLYIVGVTSVLGFFVVRDLTADPMQRNHYGRDRTSCQCDYPTQCRPEGDGWAGPWYARDEEDRQPGDAGPGECRTGSGSMRAGGYGLWGSRSDQYRSPARIEAGHRGGFGGSSRVRSASS
jgi:hypothetical protein